MAFAEIKLPSNKKFGFFFTFIFIVVAVYFYYATSVLLAYTFAAVSLIFLGLTLIKAEILLPLNIIWIRLGLLLGFIVSPIILGIIFFGLFTPIAFFMRLFGRDELRLKFTRKPSHWIIRKEQIKSESFKYQF